VRQRTDRASACCDNGSLKTVISKGTSMKTNLALALVVAGTLASGFAIGKNEDKGHGNKGHSSKGHSDRGNSDHGNGNKGARHDGGDKGARHDGRDKSARHDGGRRDHFGDHHRVVLHDYYGQQFRSGRCPPGLAKKHNGCLPPGQAKKWHAGQHLPHNVVYYSVPQSLVIQFGPPPSGHRYVRVGTDILLIAIGTRMIVDALSG
jgi:Ni/Co efflux regulator RcnB